MNSAKVIEVNGIGLCGGDPEYLCEQITVRGSAITTRRLATLFRVLKAAEQDANVLERLADMANRIECEDAALV